MEKIDSSVTDQLVRDAGGEHAMLDDLLWVYPTPEQQGGSRDAKAGHLGGRRWRGIIAAQQVGLRISSSDGGCELSEYSLCAPHVDGDGQHVQVGGRSTGAPIVYAGEGSGESESDAPHDLVLLSDRQGGRPLRIQVHGGDTHVVVVCFNSACHAHGNVYPSSCFGKDRVSFAPARGRALVRIPCYTHAACDRLLGGLAALSNVNRKFELQHIYDDHACDRVRAMVGLQVSGPDDALLTRAHRSRMYRGGKSSGVDVQLHHLK